MKVCKTCNIEKDISEFPKHKKYKDGLYSSCKSCKNESSKGYYLNNKEKVCDSVKLYRENNLEKVKSAVKKNYEKNREFLLEYKKNYHKDNKDKYSELNKIYQLENKDKINLIKKEYISFKRKTDKLFKLKESISGLIRSSIKNRGYKKQYRTEEILGCSINEFKSYLEYMFIDEMSWENYGDWHLDHIVPASWAKNEEEIIKLNHYKNFQPLWAKDNLIKGNRWSG
jgi:hypothetical protein